MATTTTSIQLYKTKHQTINKTNPSNLINSVFNYAVNMAAKTLVSIARTSKTDNNWSLKDHLRFMSMLITWFTVWFLRVLMDYFPLTHQLGSLGSLLDSSSLLGSGSGLGLGFGSGQDLVLFQEDEVDAPSVQALGRALTHILSILNEMPAASPKYQFAMAMADRILHGNAREDNTQLLQVNCTALSSAFERTSTLLHRSLEKTYKSHGGIDKTWIMQTLKVLPIGSYIAPYVKGLGFFFNTVKTVIGNSKKELGFHLGFEGEEEDGHLVAEKLAQELLWITNRLRAYGGVQYAFVHWSLSYDLASLALTTNPRVQGLLLNISALLFGDLYQKNKEVACEVKFRLLVLWLPLLCHANNGVSYPVLTTFEKMEIERELDEVISTLPPMDQEVILTNWLHDFSVSASEWPNLQNSYDRWCQSARQFLESY